ncbi:MAG: hypothetical protein AB8B69_07020 [Chitinophagales bacterium]
MNYKPTLIVLSTFIIGMVIGLLLAGLLIRQQLQPVRNLQTAKGIKKMVSEILAEDSDTNNQALILEILDENIAGMQALDLEYRAEMQINMDSLAKDLMPLLNEEQALNFQNRIVSNRQTIKKRFKKNNHLKELEQRIEDLESQITEQIEEDNETQIPIVNTGAKPNHSSKSKTANPPIPNSALTKTDSSAKLVVDPPFLSDVLHGYYGGNPRLINAFFLMKFDGDTSLFQNFVKQYFTGDTQQLRRVLDKQFKNRHRPRRRHKNRPFGKKQNQGKSFLDNNNESRNSPTIKPSKQAPISPTAKEQTLDNEYINRKDISTQQENLDTNFDENMLEDGDFSNPAKDIRNHSNTSLSFPDQVLMNRILQKRFSDDTLLMRDFIVNKFEGDSLQFLQGARERMKNNRMKRKERRN